MKNSQANPEQKFFTLNKEYVPKFEHDFRIEIVAEKTSEPLQRNHTWFKVISLKVSCEFF